MEAGDTVIRKKWMTKEVQEDQDRLLLQQAEISFKAGMEEGRNFETHNIVYRRGVGDGRREVVKWIESRGSLHQIVEGGVVIMRISLLYEDYEAQLKDWGYDA